MSVPLDSAEHPLEFRPSMAIISVLPRWVCLYLLSSRSYRPRCQVTHRKPVHAHLASIIIAWSAPHKLLLDQRHCGASRSAGK